MKQCLKFFAILGLVPLILFYGCHKQKEGTPLGNIFSQMSSPEVWKVPANSLAYLLGLKPGDIIISYDGELITTITELYRAKSLAKGKNENVKITVLRNGEELTLEAKPEPLGFMPISLAYSGSLAKALEDIMSHFAQPGYYNWLSALTGESFTFTLRDNDCASWGVGGSGSNYFEEIAKLTGLFFTLLWSAPNTTSSANSVSVIALIRDALEKKRVLLVRGGWAPPRQYLWGLITRYNSSDSTIYGYSIESGEEQPLTGDISVVYEVKCREKVVPDAAAFLTTVLDQALEQGLASSDTGWHSGLEAYDILVKNLSQFPVCPEGPELATEYFYRLVWRLIASKESAIRFFEDIKNALPEKAPLFDEVIGRHRAILGRLEGCAVAHRPLNSIENQEKLTRILVEIQEIENDLLGIYEEIISEM